MTERLALDSWMTRSQEVLDEYDAYRASAVSNLGRRAIDAELADEEAFYATLYGSGELSPEEIDEQLREHNKTHVEAHSSPNFYL